MVEISEATGIDIWCGLNVGKQVHHPCALNSAGKKVFDKPLPQDQSRMEAILCTLAEHGRVLMIVDQPTAIGALPIAVARAMGILIAHLHGLAMRCTAGLYLSNAKADALDAFIIADAAGPCLTPCTGPIRVRKPSPNSRL